MKKILIYLLILAFFSGAFSILWAQQQEPHPVVKEKRCEACHMAGTNDQNFTGLKNDISAACIACHPHEDANHPVMVIPDFKVPADLPLSGSKELTCITCHNPHNPRFSNRSWQAKSIAGKMGDIFRRGKQHKTYFLRRNNANGDLCFTCHKEREGE